MTQPADHLLVTFDRIGRTHAPAPLDLSGDDTRDWDAVAAAIEAYARPHLRSAYPEVVIHDRPDVGIAGSILCGLNSGGTFRIEAVA